MPRFSALALLLLPVFVLAAGEREKARLESVREQRVSLEQQLRESEATHAVAVDQLRTLEKAIAAAARKLRLLGQEQVVAHAELTGLDRELKRLTAQTAVRQAQLVRLLQHQFRFREKDALALLLAGDNPNEMARDRHFLTLLSKAKADLIAELRHDTAETRRLAGVVQQREESLIELTRSEEIERADLHRRQLERRALLGRIVGQIKAQKKEIETLRQNEQRLGNLIASLARKAAQPRSALPAKPKMSHQAGPVPAQTAKAEPTGASGAFGRLRGRLMMPVKGTVAVRFGARREDGRSVWKGLFIRAQDGADVRAIAPGVVVFAEWLRGYGNLLIIDHDDEFLSVYGNNQTLLVDVGQQVGAGRTVATVGASGGQEESGLYFELRHRGQAFDPGKWLGAH